MDISSKGGACCESEYRRSHSIGICTNRAFGITEDIEFTHYHVVRMVVRSVMRFIKDKESNIPAKVNIPVTQRVEQNLRGRYNNSMCCNCLLPQIFVRPLVWLKCTRDEPDWDRQTSSYSVTLLLAETDGWRYEPGHLQYVKNNFNDKTSL